MGPKTGCPDLLPKSQDLELRKFSVLHSLARSSGPTMNTWVIMFLFPKDHASIESDASTSSSRPLLL